MTWRAELFDDRGSYQVLDENEEYVAALDRATAERIVRAVNSHRELLEALQEAVLCLSDVVTEPNAPVLVNARAAIAKATA